MSCLHTVMVHTPPPDSKESYIQDGAGDRQGVETPTQARNGSSSGTRFVVIVGRKDRSDHPVPPLSVLHSQLAD